jgi:hypothetical protein
MITGRPCLPGSTITGPLSAASAAAWPRKRLLRATNAMFAVRMKHPPTDGQNAKLNRF